MTHRFPIKEIARQAGLGPATVDRVLNDRPHVSPQTRQRVRAAIAELTAQEAQLAARGRRLFFDVVVEAPTRFSREVQAAAEAIVPQIGGAVCRPRFLMQEIMEEAEVQGALARIQKRGSHGVCLKARDTPGIRAAVAALMAARIPVVTLATDVGGGARLAYVGLDNESAGRTAAYLVAKGLGAAASGTVLATRSHERFLGEEARAAAFAEALAHRAPGLRILGVQGGSGVHGDTGRLLSEVLSGTGTGIGTGQGDLRAVYSMGGGNGSILEALAAARRRPEIFVAHDLDRDNRALIAAGRLDFILHHDLRLDLRHAFEAFLAYHRLLPGQGAPPLSLVQVLTPENVPPPPERGGGPY